jgi:hypothetical protein
MNEFYQAKKLNADAIKTQVQKGVEWAESLAPAFTKLVELKKSEDALNAAIASGAVSTQQGAVALQNLKQQIADTTAATQVLNTAWTDMIATQAKEQEAMDATAKKVSDARLALMDAKTAADALAQALDSGGSTPGQIASLSAAAGVTTKSVDSLTTSAASASTALDNVASSANSAASSSGAGGGNATDMTGQARPTFVPERSLTGRRSKGNMTPAWSSNTRISRHR